MPASWESCSSPMLHTALPGQFTHHRDDVSGRLKMMPCGNVPLLPFPPPPRSGGQLSCLTLLQWWH